MSYRSVKRVLGETRLELKCLILFGFCMCFLIAVAFLLMERAAAGLVRNNTRSKANDLITSYLLRRHFEKWVSKGQVSPSGLAEEKLIQSMSEEFGARNYVCDVLVEDDETPFQRIATIPADEEEKKILKELAAEFAKRDSETASLEDKSAAISPDATGSPTDTLELPFVPKNQAAPIFRDREIPSQQKYQYYLPISITSSCQDCHMQLQQGESTLVAPPSVDPNSPMHAIRITFSYEETRSAIYWTWAVLITLAILTLFMGIITLYLIVRYVIVKPLKHLRDVSEQIRAGKMETRAELHTGDEFEELASSFNRMLRHLADTQDEIKHANEDLDHKVDELAQLNYRLHEMNQLKSEFLANMSHELRTPLNSILGFSEVLQGVSSLNEKQRRYAQNIQKSGRLLLDMINDILDLAKIEAGKMEVRPTDFRIETVIRAHCDLVRTLSEEKNIELTESIAKDLPTLFQDQVKLQQILTNLLSNAIKFTPEGGRIVVSAKLADSDTLSLAVADTGVGIAEEDQQIIFEKFRQGAGVLGRDNLTREYSGTGLGLSIVRELCNLLGGEIRLESEVGRGSTFEVLLPIHFVATSRSDSELVNRLDELTRSQRPELGKFTTVPPEVKESV